MELLDLPQLQKGLIEDIVGHPQRAPTRPEIEHLNPSISRETIQEHLNALCERGVVDDVSIETDRGEYECYRLTESARTELESDEMYPVKAWQRQYERAEKPDEIQELARLPRPDA